MRGPIYLSLVSLVVLSVFLNWVPRSETIIDAPKNTDMACEVFVPNVFSPNGDGINDLFLPATNCTFSDFNMKIFARWGTLLYETNDPDRGWAGAHRGEALPSTTYLYFIEYTMEQQDTTFEVFPEKLTGTIALIR